MSVSGVGMDQCVALAWCWRCDWQDIVRTTLVPSQHGTSTKYFSPWLLVLVA